VGEDSLGREPTPNRSGAPDGGFDLAFVACCFEPAARRSNPSANEAAIKRIERPFRLAVAFTIGGLCFASPLAGQSGIPRPAASPSSANLTSTERTLTVTSYGEQLATRPMDLEKINCHFQSSSNNIWVVTCGSDDALGRKPRSFVFDANRHDGSTCELTVRYVAETSKWNVDVASRLAARCAHRWVDDDHLEMRP
jgi:hypothetical protein